MEETFLAQNEENKYFQYYTYEYSSLRKKENEIVKYFSRRFNLVYNNIPMAIKPTNIVVMISYCVAFPIYFFILLGEMFSDTLIQMHANTLETEGNLTSASRMKRVDP